VHGSLFMRSRYNIRRSMRAAATTWSEYKKYFEKDAALARRFQVVKVEEPSEEQCCTMLRGIVSALEKHHDLRILDEAVRGTVRLSHRYLAGRQLPDKAVSVLDTACARLSLGQNTTPPSIEDTHRQIDDMETQKRILEREALVGADHAERIRAIDQELADRRNQLESLTAQWEKESTLVRRIREHRSELELAAGDGKSGAAGGESGTAALAALEAELAQVQGKLPMMRVCVDEQIVGEVISAWTGIPLEKW
jgi:type VI secretion system protein VasG